MINFSFIWTLKMSLLGCFLLALGNQRGYAEGATTKATQPSSIHSDCQDHIRITLEYNGSTANWSRKYLGRIYADGRFEVSDREQSTKHPDREVTVKGKMEQKTLLSIFAWLDRQDILSSKDQPVSSEKIKDFADPAPWYFSYCKGGRIKTIQYQAPYNPIPTSASNLIKQVQEEFDKQLASIGVKISKWLYL